MSNMAENARMETKNRSLFSNFLEHILSSREVSLAIAPNNEALKELVDLASAQGFTQCHDAYEVVRKLEYPDFNLFIALNADLPKPLYDIVTQYPTGLVQLNDPETLAPIVVNPHWEKNAILIIASKNAISAAQAAGFNLLQRVGLCWQPLP